MQLQFNTLGDWVGTFEGHKGAVWGVALNGKATLAASVRLLLLRETTKNLNFVIICFLGSCRFFGKNLGRCDWRGKNKFSTQSYCEICCI